MQPNAEHSYFKSFSPVSFASSSSTFVASVTPNPPVEIGHVSSFAHWSSFLKSTDDHYPLPPSSRLPQLPGENYWWVQSSAVTYSCSSSGEIESVRHMRYGATWNSKQLLALGWVLAVELGSKGDVRYRAPGLETCFSYLFDRLDLPPCWPSCQ